VAGFKALFQISTKFVHNFVDKQGLDSLKARTDAGFNKLPIPRANRIPIKINDLCNPTMLADKKNKLMKKINFCA